MEHVTSEKFMHDMRVVVADAEELLKLTASLTGERAEKLRQKAEESLRLARARLEDAALVVEARAKEAVQNVNLALGLEELVGIPLAPPSS